MWNLDDETEKEEWFMIKHTIVTIGLLIGSVTLVILIGIVLSKIGG